MSDEPAEAITYGKTEWKVRVGYHRNRLRHIFSTVDLAYLVAWPKHCDVGHAIKLSADVECGECSTLL